MGIQIEEDVAKRARFLTWVRSLKNDANFKVQQLEQQLRAVKLANEKERTEKEKLKRERDGANEMLEAKRQEVLNAEKKKLEDERKRFEEQQAVARHQLQEQEARFEAMMKVKEREIVENKHRIYKDNWVRGGILDPKLLVIQNFWKQKVAQVRIKQSLHEIKNNLSSVKIQTLVRKVQAAQRYETILHGVIALQSVMRMKFVQRSFRAEIPTRKSAIERYDQSRKYASEARRLYVENLNLKNQNEQVTAENATIVRNTEGIHKDITCPITLQRFVDPVTATDGVTYERAAIEDWFATGSTVSPITGAPLNNRILVPCHKIKAIANAYATITQNNDIVLSMDAQLQVVRGEYQQRFEESVRIHENLGMENADLRRQLATANDSIGVKDHEMENLRQQLATANDSIGVKDQEIANLQQQLATANDIFKSLRIKTKTYANGDVYVGQMKDGKKHGFGKFTWADGNVYDGDWKDGKRNGKGTLQLIVVRVKVRYMLVIG